MKDLIQYLSEHKNKTPHAHFIVYQDQQWTYKQIFDRSAHFSTNLKNKNIHQKGQNIGLLLDDSPEFIIAYYGILQAGCTAVLLPTHLNASQLNTLTKYARINTLIYAAKYRVIVRDIESIRGKPFLRLVCGQVQDKEMDFNSLLHENVMPDQHSAINLDQPAVILFTAGSTGFPKGVILSHNNIVSNALACVEIFEKANRHHIFGYPPLYYFISHQLVLNQALIMGGTMILSDQKNPDAIIETLQKAAVSIFVGSPTILRALLAEKEQLKQQPFPNLKICISLCGTLSARELNQCEKYLECAILEGYGLTEAGLVSINRLGYDRRPASIGKPLACNQMKVVDENGAELTPEKIGELHINGSNVFHSYLNPKKAHEAGKQWFATSDLASKDLEDFFYHEGHISDQIHKFGFVINPKEIEAIIVQHPLIEQIIALKLIGENDDSQIKLCIVPKKEAKLKTQEILEYAREHLPKFLYPDFIEFYKQLPRNKMGKLMRDQLIRSNKNIY